MGLFFLLKCAQFKTSWLVENFILKRIENSEDHKWTLEVFDIFKRNFKIYFKEIMEISKIKRTLSIKFELLRPAKLLDFVSVEPTLELKF